MEIKMIDSKDTNVNNREEDIEKKDEKNIDLLMADIFLHAIAIMHMHWRKQDAIDCLEFFVLFYLYHFLYISDEKT